MSAVKLQIKVFAAPEVRLDPHRLVPVWHRWVKERVIAGELLIDVADYTHVERGPSILLVGHGSDYYWDEDEGRPGLLFSRKRGGPAELSACLRDTTFRALDAARRLEEDPALAGLRFVTAEVLVRVNDRLAVPRSSPAADATERHVGALFGKLLAPEAPIVERVGEAREPFALSVRARSGPQLHDLIARL